MHLKLNKADLPPMDLSVVIPVYNEEESINELAGRIENICIGNKLEYEIIFIDDGSSDSSWKVITALSEKNKSIRGLRFRRNYGKAAALHSGFIEAGGDVVITMDSDLQDRPEEIPDLVRMIKHRWL